LEIADGRTEHTMYRSNKDIHPTARAFFFESGSASESGLVEESMVGISPCSG
jgi:hypothetical protein